MIKIIFSITNFNNLEDTDNHLDSSIVVLTLNSNFFKNLNLKLPEKLNPFYFLEEYDLEREKSNDISFF